MAERLQKVIAQAGVASRRKAEKNDYSWSSNC